MKKESIWIPAFAGMTLVWKYVMRCGLTKDVVSGVLAAILLLGLVGSGYAEDDFLERYALADDREAVLEDLLPGTEDYYFYHCLHYQNTDRLDEVDSLLDTWIKRHSRSQRARQIQLRQALLRYKTHPKEALGYLHHEFNLHFGHQRETPGKKPNRPTALNPASISRDTLKKRALSLSQYRETVAGFEDRALDWLIGERLDEKRLRDLLKRLRRPDHANLVQLIIKDLNARHSGGFGSLPIHRALLLSQLDELLEAKPNLLKETAFVETYIARLTPNADEDWEHDPKAREAYLNRLETFVNRLAPVHNSLKAHVLYHRLVHDRAQGQFDKQRFMAYIGLPRDRAYVNREYLRKNTTRIAPVDLNHNFSPLTGLPVVGDDEKLIRSYLDRFFVEENSYETYALYLNDIFLKEVFAETKITHGLGDMEQWYSLMPPAKYQALKNRVDIEFDHANEVFFGPNDPVSISLWVKNVEKLVVRVFEINTVNYCRQNGRDVNTDIDLDGLVANDEQIYSYTEPPLRRVKRAFSFPKLEGRGAWVIEFIGNGQSSRALIRKGRFTHRARTSTAGHVFTVLDEARNKVNDATLWLDGHEYTPGTDGTITVPFTKEPGQQSIVLSQGGFASMARFMHQPEDYRLVAGIHVDRESLRRQRTAKVSIRPALYITGTPVTLSVLEEPRLSITSVDIDGVSTTQDVPNFELFEDKLSVHEFRVPDALASISFSLHAKVQKLTEVEKTDLVVSDTFHLNQVDATAQTEALHLSRVGGEYVLDLLGKTGEIQPHRVADITLKHRDFKDEIYATLQTDENGRIRLGQLDDIRWIKAVKRDGPERIWTLEQDTCAYPRTIHEKAGSPIHVPYMGSSSKPDRSEFSLLAVSNGFERDCFDALSIEDTFLNIVGLQPGDYNLLLKEPNVGITIRVTDGVEQEGYVLADYRRLETGNNQPLQIADVKASAQQVEIRLANFNKFSCAHVIATKFMPRYPVYDALSAVWWPEPGSKSVPRFESAFVSGRDIGDEYRYILERKYATKYPGNMLERPQLLLNPWAVSKTEMGRQEAAPPGPPPPPMAEPAMSRETAKAEGAGIGIPRNTDYAALDFLGGDSAVLLNLKPDANGVITIDRALLAGRQHLHVVALDPKSTVYRQVSLEEGDIPTRDLRLANSLDLDKHFSERKEITVLRTTRWARSTRCTRP